MDVYTKRQSRHEELNWTCPIQESDVFSETWYRYLSSLYCTFSEYERLASDISYSVAGIEDWKRNHFEGREKPIDDAEASEYNEGQRIDRNNFESFLNKTEIYDIEEQDSIRNITVTEFQLQELNHVLDLTINEKIHISCKEPYLFIKGNNIITSKIKLYTLAGVIDDSCRGLLFTKRLKYMNIFALNTIFIDDHLQERKDLITIIAPKWKIVGRKRIELNGENGEFQKTGAAENRHFLHGIDGKPGTPGEPGGNFFGIGEEFINGDNLIISVNGGHGGPGQDGANGENGRDGISPPVPSGIPCNRGLCDDDKKINHFECEELFCKTGISPVYHQSDIKGCTYLIHGEQGSRGGNGGNGGKGGKGGNSGDIIFFELNGHSRATQIKNFGPNGLDGRGGVGGVGGRKGNKIHVKCEVQFLGSKWSLIKSDVSNERAASGQDGVDGENTKNMQIPRAAAYISMLDRAKIINQYKSFLRVNFNDRFRQFFLMNFLNRLESNHDVKSVCDILGFVDELKTLEEQFNYLNKDVDLLRFYESLLNRISEYAQKLTGVQDSNDKKVLGYLYTAILGRIHNLEDDLESDLIIDVAAYLESVKNDIDKLKDFQNAKAKEEIANKYKIDYKHEIDLKIKDAKDLISKEIRPEIDNIETDIDNQIESLINEVVHLQSQSRIESEELRKKQEQLETILLLQGFFGSLKILGSVVSFVGPAGAVAGSVIGIGSSLAETYILDVPSISNSTIPNLKQSVTDLNSLKDQIKSFSDQKVNVLKKTLENVSQEIDKHPDVFAEMSVKISNMKSRLVTVDENKLNIKEVQNLEIELKKTLQSQKNKLINAQEGTDDKKNENAFVVIDKLQKAVQLSSVTADTYFKYKENQGKLDKIEKAIQENEDKFNKLKQYEDKIYDTMIPMLENIESDLDDIVSKIDTKSKVVLDVTKWKVKNTLKDMMLQMQQLTRDFKVQGSLVRCIEKLREAFLTLIKVQDHIQDYQKDQTFANFIAGISSITATDIDISYNPILERDLRQALHDLEITMRASIVTQRHKIAINAFKQFVFPFAHMYFKGSMLPSHLQLDNANFDNLTSGAVTHIEQIKSKLEEYKESLKKLDGCIGTGEFKSEYVYSQPFYVWKNEEHQNMISKLLSGEEVIVKADIMHSAPHNDAIKFNYIEFDFKSKDKTVQSEINTALKGFRITATHLGNSYYRYADNIYLMTTADHDIWYSYEKNSNGEPVHRSSSYDKIKNGDFMLSPYASWKIKLDNIANVISFEDLEFFKHAVDFELGGNGHYLIRSDLNCLDLMVDKYYKAVNAYNADHSVPLLEDHTLRRGRREINQDSSNEESIWTIQNNHTHQENENNNANSSGWLSKFRFPKFNMRRAKTSTLKEYALNPKEPTSSTGNTVTPLVYDIELLDNAVSSKSTADIDNYNLSEEIPKDYTDYVIQEKVSKSSKNLEVGFNGSLNNNYMQAVASFDINSSLALGQLLVDKIYGKNRSVSDIHYVSPEQEKYSNINKLASRILPIVNNVSSDDHNMNNFIENYRNAPQWYKDLYKTEFEEIIEQN